MDDSINRLEQLESQVRGLKELRSQFDMLVELLAIPCQAANPYEYWLLTQKANERERDDVGLLLDNANKALHRGHPIELSAFRQRMHEIFPKRQHEEWLEHGLCDALRQLDKYRDIPEYFDAHPDPFWPSKKA